MLGREGKGRFQESMPFLARLFPRDPLYSVSAAASICLLYPLQDLRAKYQITAGAEPALFNLLHILCYHQGVQE